jgi:hypothetical protein
LMLVVNFDSEPTIHLVPVESETTWSQPRVLQSDKYQGFLSEIAKRSDLEARTYVVQGSIPWQKIRYR